MCGHVIEDDRVRADPCSLTNRHRADDLGTRPDLDVPVNRGAGVVALSESDRHERPDLRAGMDLYEPIDDHMTVRKTYSRVYEHRIADRHLRPEDRGTVSDTSQADRTGSETGGLQSVEHQGPEGIALPDEPENPEQQIQARR